MLPEQVGIPRSRGERNLSADVAVMGLQAKGDGGDDEQKEKEAGHGSNLATRGFLPPVADTIRHERKLP